MGEDPDLMKDDFTNHEGYGTAKEADI